MTPPLRKQKDTDLLWDGIQTRMLYLFSEGVKKRGRFMKRFVEVHIRKCSKILPQISSERLYSAGK